MVDPRSASTKSSRTMLSMLLSTSAGPDTRTVDGSISQSTLLSRAPGLSMKSMVSSSSLVTYTGSVTWMVSDEAWRLVSSIRRSRLS